MFFASCSFFSSDKNLHNQNLDEVVDYTKVDVSPFFEVCKNKMEKEKTACFRMNMHKHMMKYLGTSTNKLSKKVNETVTVFLLINKKGNVSLKEVKASPFIEKEMPDLFSLIETSVKNLPKLSPAIKRGIPVTTQYELPIKISVE